MSTALNTDRYELTMLQAALKSGKAQRKCVFEVFTRQLPAGRRYGVVAGTGRVLEAIQNFRFEEKELDFLRTNSVVDESTLTWLANYKFSGNVFGYREGELYFGQSPVLTVEGSFAEAVILETVILSILNYDSAVASAAARMKSVSAGRRLIEMGSRRAHESAAIAAARASFIAGFDGTSNLAAGALYGIETAGTSAGTADSLAETISDIPLAQGTAATDYLFGEVLASTLSGTVYLDISNDGVLDLGEPLIGGVLITLSGTDDRGDAVNTTFTTLTDGTYAFPGLRPGDYTLTETQPAAYNDGLDAAGTLGGTVANDAISAITATSGSAGTGYNFGERGTTLAGNVWVDRAATASASWAQSQTASPASSSRSSTATTTSSPLPPPTPRATTSSATSRRATTHSSRPSPPATAAAPSTSSPSPSRLLASLTKTSAKP